MSIPPQLLPYIESICARGCDTVRNVITELENGRHNSEISSLSADDQARILVELKAIMAIYDNRQPDDSSSSC